MFLRGKREGVGWGVSGSVGGHHGGVLSVSVGLANDVIVTLPSLILSELYTNIILVSN